ncbi:hypothetical protein Tco_1292029 [Tanacetum coccineum]
MILEPEERLPSLIQALDSISTHLSPWISYTSSKPIRLLKIASVAKIMSDMSGSLLEGINVCVERFTLVLIVVVKWEGKGKEKHIDKWYDCRYLKEIVVRRADRKLYKFMKCDFPRLHLNDIEDMLLLVVQNKLFNLEGDVIVDVETVEGGVEYVSF